VQRSKQALRLSEGRYETTSISDTCWLTCCITKQTNLQRVEGGNSWWNFRSSQRPYLIPCWHYEKVVLGGQPRDNRRRLAKQRCRCQRSLAVRCRNWPSDHWDVCRLDDAGRPRGASCCPSFPYPPLLPRQSISSERATLDKWRESTL